jgi:hypothetical protein
MKVTVSSLEKDIKEYALILAQGFSDYTEQHFHVWEIEKRF